jgi:hypothetical protein
VLDLQQQLVLDYRDMLVQAMRRAHVKVGSILSVNFEYRQDHPDYSLHIFNVTIPSKVHPTSALPPSLQPTSTMFPHIFSNLAKTASVSPHADSSVVSASPDAPLSIVDKYPLAAKKKAICSINHRSRNPAGVLDTSYSLEKQRRNMATRMTSRCTQLLLKMRSDRHM